MSVSLVRPFVLCPLSEQEAARKVLVARMTEISASIVQLIEWAEELDDVELAVVIGFASQEFSKARARAMGGNRG